MNRITQQNEAKQSSKTGADYKSASITKGAAITPAPYGVDFVDRSAGGEPHFAPHRDTDRPGVLPNVLQAGIRSMSGVDLSDVQVHTNSPKPARINALAYARGNEIHLGPGHQRHLPHEAWHIVQQRQGGVRPTIQAKGALINDDRSLEREADERGARAQQLGPQAQPADASIPHVVDAVLATSSVQRSVPQTSAPIQRSIGIEVEVPVPVDSLTDIEVTSIKNDVNLESIATTPKDKLDFKNAALQKARKVTYGTVRNSQDGFHVDVDHESRVLTPGNPYLDGWPMREGGLDSIMEIVTEKADTLAEFNTTMDKVSEFVDSVESHTDHLKTRWKDPFGTGVSVGPLDYSDIGIDREKRPNHNWMGSVQVNIGIDVREYASLAKWYAKSTYADPKRASTMERDIYRQSQENILEAVNVVRDMVKDITKDLRSDDKKNMGNLRGLRGWLTHLALYMIGGKSGVPKTTAKNITPILLKSPQDIAIWYGMTSDESTYFLTYRDWMMSQLIVRTGRTDLDKDNPLTADVVKGKATNEAYQSGILKMGVGLTKAEENALVAYGTTVGDLSDYADRVAYTGKPLPGQQPVGPVRTGSTAVRGIPAVSTGGRGGVVVEFRNLPGFYDGPAKWKGLGQEFFKEADKRNKRGGVKP